MARLQKVSDTFHATELDGELVMIHGGTGKFFALKDVGLFIWNALDDESDLHAICDRLVSLYDIDHDACSAAVETFAGQLVDVGFARYV